MDLGKAFDRVPRIVFEWAMRKKGIPEVFIRSVMSLHKVTKTRVRVDSGLSEEFQVIVGKAPRICAVTFSFGSGGRCCH